MKAPLYKTWILIWMAWMLGAFALAQDGTYRLMPDDLLRIQVYNEQQINALVPVGKDGNISAPFVGILRAQGKTTSELEAELVQEYIKRLKLRDPKVSVTIERYREMRATVGGTGVNRPQTITFRPGDTLITLLNQGSPDPDRADLRRATLRRSNSRELIPVDLKALWNGDTSQNYSLEDGDELIIPENERNRIVVWGAVQAPGNFPYKEPMTVLQALALARGEVQNKSWLSRVKVFRQNPGSEVYAEIKCDLVRFFNKSDSSQNILLQPGDIVFVPTTKTPDFATISQAVNTAFFLDRLLKDGLFGLPIPLIGK